MTRSAGAGPGPSPRRGRTPRPDDHPEPAAPRRHRAVEPPPQAEPPRSAGGGLSGLLRGASTAAFGGLGIDGPARSLDRVAASAERAADFLDRIDDEVGLRRAAHLVDRLELVAELLEGRGPMARRIDRLMELAEDSNRALREIEAVVIDLDERLRRSTAEPPSPRGRGTRTPPGPARRR